VKLSTGAVSTLTSQNAPVLERVNKVPCISRAAYVTDVPDEAFVSSGYNATLASDDVRDTSHVEELGNQHNELNADSCSPASRSRKDLTPTAIIVSIDEDDLHIDSLVHKGYTEEEEGREEHDAHQLNAFGRLPPIPASDNRARNRRKRDSSRPDNADNADAADETTQADDTAEADDTADADETTQSDADEWLPSASPTLRPTPRRQANQPRIPEPQKKMMKQKKMQGSQLTQCFSTPSDLANAFGTGDVKARISTLMQDWDRVSRTQLLHGVVMPHLATSTAPAGETRYVDLLLWHGQQLRNNTIDGELYSLQSRIDYANYHSLYKVAVEDVRKNKRPLFFQWTDEWIRRQGHSPQKRRISRGYGAKCAVLDRLVQIHSLDHRSTVVKTRARWVRTIEDWRKKGETPFEIMNRFGAEMMLLIPQEATDTQ